MNSFARSFFLIAGTLTTAATVLATPAKADVIHCAFTEPFVTTDYSMAQQTLTIVDHVSSPAKKTVLKNISFQIKGPATFELIDAKQKTVQSLKLTNQGSDGMSEIVYPYEVTFSGLRGNNIGGCVSNFLKQTDAH